MNLSKAMVTAFATIVLTLPAVAQQTKPLSMPDVEKAPSKGYDPSPTKDKCEMIANAYWSGKQGKGKCICNAGYRWNTAKTECVK